MDEDLKQQVNTLEQRIQSLETKVSPLSYTPDPQSQQVFDEQKLVEYTTTLPADAPRANGVSRIYFDATDYWLYEYANSGWRRTKLDGAGFPTTVAQGDLLYYSGSAWVVLNAGTSGYFLKTQGAGANPIWAQISQDQIVKNYTKVDASIAVGDVVSYLAGGTLDVLSNVNYVDDIEIGRATNVFSRGIKFTAPIGMVGFTIYLSGMKKTGSPADDFQVKLRATGSTPGSITETQTVANASITTSYQEFTLTFSSTLVAGTSYWLEFRRSGSSEDINNYFVVKSCNQADFNFYFTPAGTTDTADTWSASPGEMTNFRLNKAVTAGLYRTLDVPNGIGLHGGVKGVAKTVNGGDVDVVISGSFTTSGLTAETDYYVSTTTPGALTATIGAIHVGRSNLTTSFEVFSKKTIRKAYLGATMEVLTTGNTIKIELGFKPLAIKCVAVDDPQMSVGYAIGTSSKALQNIDSGTASMVSLWSTADGTSGSAEGGIALGDSSVTFTISSAATSKTFSGLLIFEN